MITLLLDFYGHLQNIEIYLVFVWTIEWMYQDLSNLALWFGLSLQIIFANDTSGSQIHLNIGSDGNLARDPIPKERS